MSNSEALNFLRILINVRLNAELNGGETEFSEFVTDQSETSLGKFIQDQNLNTIEIIILLLALAPHLDPGFFQSAITPFLPNGGDFPEFGGVKGKNHRGIMPTGETVLYILAGSNQEKRIEYYKYFEEEHLFAKKSILYIEPPEYPEPVMSGRLIMDDEYVQLFAT